MYRWALPLGAGTAAAPGRAGGYDESVELAVVVAG